MSSTLTVFAKGLSFIANSSVKFCWFFWHQPEIPEELLKNK